eukprot:3533554-Pyramimonas_sp.AAC.1
MQQNPRWRVFTSPSFFTRWFLVRPLPLWFKAFGAFLVHADQAQTRSLLKSKPAPIRMHNIACLVAACFILVGAQAVKLGVGIVGHVASADNDWLVGVSTQGDMECS